MAMLSMLLVYELWEPCQKIADGECKIQGLLFAVDQTSKGIFADLFDVYEIDFSDARPSNFGLLGKYWIFIYRTYSSVVVIGFIVSLFTAASVSPNKKPSGES